MKGEEGGNRLHVAGNDVATPQKTILTVAPFPRSIKANPYCDLLCDHLEELNVAIVRDSEFAVDWLRKHRGRIDVLHFHWLAPHYQHWRGGVFTFLSAGFFFLKLILARRWGYTIVWTMHNYRPHGSRTEYMDVIVRAAMVRMAKVIVHCNYARTLLERSDNGRHQIHVIPHGSYISHYPNTINREDARRRLGLPADAHVFLCFGLIRAYKGVEEMVRAFEQLHKSTAHLLIVGRPFGKDGEEIVENLKKHSDNSRIHLEARFVPDEDVQLYFNACDVVVCPFEDILTSGSVILGLSFKRGVIVPNIGCLRELENSGAAIVYDRSDSSGLLEAMRESVCSDVSQLGEKAFALASDLRWDRIAKMHLDVYVN